MMLRRSLFGSLILPVVVSQTIEYRLGEENGLSYRLECPTGPYPATCAVPQIDWSGVSSSGDYRNDRFTVTGTEERSAFLTVTGCKNPPCFVTCDTPQCTCRTGTKDGVQWMPDGGNCTVSGEGSSFSTTAPTYSDESRVLVDVTIPQVDDPNSDAASITCIDRVRSRVNFPNDSPLYAFSTGHWIKNSDFAMFTNLVEGSPFNIRYCESGKTCLALIDPACECLLGSSNFTTPCSMATLVPTPAPSPTTMGPTPTNPPSAAPGFGPTSVIHVFVCSISLLWLR